jgi:long-chain acyl-CoA synthetase
LSGTVERGILAAVNAGFFAVAASDPVRDVLVEPSGTVVQAGELAGRMNRCAHLFDDLALGDDDAVAVMLSNRRELLELYGGAIQSGRRFVAVNWHLADGEIAYLLQDAGAGVLVTEGRFAETARAAAVAAGMDTSRVFSVDGGNGLRSLAEVRDRLSTDPPAVRRAGQIMFFTSGTTGRPKGVRKTLRHDAGDEVTLGIGIGLRPGAVADAPERAVHLVSGPLYHALPIAAAAGALDQGALLVLIDQWTPEAFLERVARHRVTNATMVPTMFHRLLALPDDLRAAADVSSLRTVMHGGAPCPVDVKRRMIEWWGPVLTEAYSSTEGAGTTVTSEEWLRKPGTVGRPSPGVELRILDDDGNECPVGTPGRVFLTPTLWEFEYHHDREKTEAARRGGLFTVGDIGYLDDDGYLFLCDREADTINSGGVNIYPAEVEAVLLEHPAVRDAAVIGVPNDEWGEEVRALVEPADGATAGDALSEELVGYCRSRIAHFKCPRAVDFVESLGRDPNGKLRKHALRAPYWAGRSRSI